MRCEWTVRARDGAGRLTARTADALVLATGQLTSRPARIEDWATSPGNSFTRRAGPRLRLRGKRVAVIGTGAARCSSSRRSPSGPRA